MQRNIPEEQRPQPEAISVDVPLRQFHIEGLHVTCSGGFNSVTKQTITLLVAQHRSNC